MPKTNIMTSALLLSMAFANAAVDSCMNHHKGVPCLPAQAKTSSCSPEMCLSKPTSMTFFYTGGDCKHSYHMQKNSHFFCADFVEGGAPSNIGDSSYIKVIDTTGQGNTTYHADWVRVGEQFTLFNNGDEFDDSLVITIWNNDTLFQEIIFQTTCDGNLFLCDRFGSVELCGLANEQQGIIEACPPQDE